MIRHFIGLMSGTSLDGVDGVVMRHSDDGMTVVCGHHLPMPPDLRRSLLALNTPGHNELHEAALATNGLMQCHAQVVHALLAATGLSARHITAIGIHGQTVRHQPGPLGASVNTHTPWLAYSWQLCNPALLAELCGAPVVADFRSRDVAAGGQGAPLVPAFHRAAFEHAGAHVAVVNIGGMANATLLMAGEQPRGFDTGPGNVLMDLWCEAHTAHSYDADGAWAAAGNCHHGLLRDLLAEPYFSQTGARSTGRDLFNASWLQSHLQQHPTLSPVDVQATLLALTARTIAQALPAQLQTCVVCGGGALNSALMTELQTLLQPIPVVPSDVFGLPVMQVEAAAFAWLSMQTIEGLPGNVPEATGACGPRVLGAIYPA